MSSRSAWRCTMAKTWGFDLHDHGIALLGGPLVVATIIQKFRVELVPDHPVVPDPTFTLRPKYGVKVRLLPR